MGAVALALLTAVSYGVSDFVGGILSKSRPAWSVAALSYAGAIPLVLIAALFAGGDPGLADFAWAAGAGVGGGVGIGALYSGLARGRMSVVAPISGIGPVVIPAVVGVAIGQVPSALAWIGIALAIPAVYLIPRAPGGGGSAPDAAGGRGGDGSGGRLSSADVAAGLVAAAGFGTQYALIGQIDHGAGLFPVAVLMSAGALTVIAVATWLGEPWRPRRGEPPTPLVAGALSAIAVVSFTFATRLGLLPVVSVVGALYPAATVILAAIVLNERLGRVQAFGLALAAVAVALVSLG
jgi:drug/metabolite transporter (DMT)-like permease